MPRRSDYSEEDEGGDGGLHQDPELCEDDVSQERLCCEEETGYQAAGSSQRNVVSSGTEEEVSGLGTAANVVEESPSHENSPGRVPGQERADHPRTEFGAEVVGAEEIPDTQGEDNHTAEAR